MEADITLLNDVRMMDKDALVQIFDLYAPPLYRYALHLCGDPVIADHVVGDVFVKLLDQLSLGKGPTSNLRAYLYQTTYHLVVDEARRSRSNIPLEAVSSMGEDAYVTSLSWEDRFLVETIVRAIQKDLSIDQRHVIILRFLEEFSLLETASILGKRVDHVKVIQGRAIAKLRQVLNYEEVRKNILSSKIKKSQRVGAPRGVPA